MTNILDIAEEVIKQQSEALKTLSQNIPKDFTSLVQNILKLKGRVILIGMGKSGYIARKIAASLASTGTPSFFIHPAEASHGDLGMITSMDLVIMISKSGETKELFETINYCKKNKIKIAAITMQVNSTLAKNSDFVLSLPVEEESSSLPAPTTSTLMTLSLGDALVTSLYKIRKFTKENFKEFHPAGKIGLDLLTVSDIMHVERRPLTVNLEDSLKDVLSDMNMNRSPRVCAIVFDNKYQTQGVITFETLRDNDDVMEDIMTGTADSNLTAADVMSPVSTIIDANILASEALIIMKKQSVEISPVTKNDKLIGVVHINDFFKAGVV